ncbi:MAG: pseudouridine synthase, partial [Mesorhizobium sp.]
MTSKPLGQPSKAARRSTAGKVSLNRALSKLGFCSRKQAELLIAKGRVRVGGKVARDPALWVDPERESITVDGERI